MRRNPYWPLIFSSLNNSLSWLSDTGLNSRSAQVQILRRGWQPTTQPWQVYGEWIVKDVRVTFRSIKWA